MVTHLFHLKTDEQKKSVKFLSGLTKFLIPSLIICFCLATLICYLILTIFAISSSSFNYDSFKKSLQIFFSFFILNQKTKFLIKYLIFIYLAYKTIVKFFEVLTFNSIKTNNVVVDKSILILNLNDIWATSKTICWMKGEIESFLFEKSPENSVMYKIWQQKNLEPKACYFSKNLNNEKAIENIEQHFMLAKKVKINFNIFF